jgi:hypothetical protein
MKCVQQIRSFRVPKKNHSSILKMEAAGSSETVVPTYNIYIMSENNLQLLM